MCFYFQTQVCATVSFVASTPVGFNNVSNCQPVIQKPSTPLPIHAARLHTRSNTYGLCGSQKVRVFLRGGISSVTSSTSVYNCGQVPRALGLRRHVRLQGDFEGELFRSVLLLAVQGMLLFTSLPLWKQFRLLQASLCFLEKRHGGNFPRKALIDWRLWCAFCSCVFLPQRAVCWVRALLLLSLWDSWGPGGPSAAPLTSVSMHTDGSPGAK